MIARSVKNKTRRNSLNSHKKALVGDEKIISDQLVYKH